MQKLVAINTSDAITGTTEIFSMVDRIDLLKIPVNIPDDADIHFINDLVEEEYLDNEPTQVIAFGYPPGQGNVAPFYSRLQRLNGTVNPNGFAEYDASLKERFPDASDSARAIIAATSRYYYFIKPYAARGYSGSPVFGRFRNENNETVYRFAGVIFAGQPGTLQTWTIRGNIALQYLKGK